MSMPIGFYTVYRPTVVRINFPNETCFLGFLFYFLFLVVNIVRNVLRMLLDVFADRA